MQQGLEKVICIGGGHLWPGEDKQIVEGGLLIRGKEVLQILNPREVAEASANADEFVDASHMLLMPPLSNGHVHSTSTLFRGTENSFPLELWANYIMNYDRGLSMEGLRIASLMTDLEMIRNGVGAYVDHYPQTDFGEVGIDAHIESGLRVGFAPYFADLWDEDILGIPVDQAVVKKLSPAAPKTTDRVREACVELARASSSKGASTVTFLIGPNAPQRCSDAMLETWRWLQDTLDVGSHTHLLETVPQASSARKRWPGGMIDMLDGMGLLHDRLSVGHGLWLTKQEKRLLSDRGVTISYNPLSNAMLGSGRKTVREDLDLGLRIGLGTDCSNTGGRHDLFEVMRHMLISGREAGSDFETWLSPQEVLSSATRGAAGVLGSDAKIGLLTKGGPADVLLLDFDQCGLIASTMSFNSVVVHADPRNVHSLMVNGTWLLRDGAILTLDERSIASRAKDLAKDVRRFASDLTQDIKRQHTPFKQWHQQAFASGYCSNCGQPLASAEARFSCAAP